uniref:probable serine/threonine-protein kinase DDB_G0278845 isoform X2 n=1 Tax=Bombus vancouverensis nearcticus TaxID=2705178 RepID=UPI00143A8D40|nr:probable serine/threonine-protein kinase DDB_G0278845 isoform X2 [Bombus vancouverensis nearcticus]
MFGTKLRTWMEAHIVRSKKKKDRKGKGEKGFDSNSNSPRNGSHRSPALHQVHPVDSPSRNVDEIRLHGEDGNRCGTVTASSGTSAGTGSVNLSSPESAYSTGYSTDGTSPGTSYPPEYYINIRTGTHYFQSNANVNAGTATGNYSNNNNNNNNNNSSSKNNNNNNNGRPKKPSDSSDLPVASASLLSGRNRHGRFEGNVEPSVSGCVTMFSAATTTMDKLGKDVARSNEYGRTSKRSALPKERRTEESFSAESSRSNLTEPPPPSSIPPPLLSPTVQSPRERSRIRTNPWLSANSSGSSTTTTGFKSRLNIDDTSSGSGLKLTESSGSASDVNASSARVGRARRESKQESLSAGRSPINQNWRIASGMEIRPKIALSVQRRNSSSSSTSSGSSTNSSSGSSSDGGSNVSSVAGSNGTGGSSSNDNEDGNRNGNEKENGNGNGNRKGSSASSITRSARSSEDDITLNEMMGKFDESYVYEKETDILSDSDPTDCEDYIESLSDLDAVRDGADENDPLGNDDFDYIDNGSFLDLDNLDCTGRFTNTGHCTYFAFAGELARRSSRLRESLMKRRNRDDAATAAAAAMLQRTISAKNTAKKQTARHKKQPTDEKQQQSSEKRKKRCSQRRKPNFDKRDPNTSVIGGVVGRNNDRNGDDDHNNDDDEETAANLNRVLVERMLLKNSGFNQGSRSVGGTPICLRRKKQNCDVNKNLSPLRSTDERSSAGGRLVTGDLDVVKRRSNSVSYVNGNLVRRRLTTTDNNTYMATFASEIALIEADKEADKKYRELILEAENILVNMQKNQTSLPIVPSPSRKFHNGLTNKRVELIKNTELNIELALSKSRNSQPELQSGSIKDLEHTSPKRQQFVQPCSPMRRFVERNVSPPVPGATAATYQSTSIKCTIDSPLVSRRKATATMSQRQSPDKSMLRCSRPRVYENQDPDDYDGRRVNTMMASTTDSPSTVTMFNCNGIVGSDQCAMRSQTCPYLVDRPRCTFLSHTDSFPGISRRELRTSRSSLNAVTKEEGVTSSSSDSEDRCDVRRRAPLMTFRSVDMGPIKEGSSYCPQSEPVKRKVYAGSATYGRIQKTLGEHVTLRNSDGDTATDDTDDSRRSLKEKVARLRQERLAANASVNAQDSQIFQHQLSRLRRQMLMQTIEGLKRSLEDQSATLKQTCLEPVMTDRLP